MIWLIGHKGLLGSEVFRVLTDNKIPFIFSDTDVDITNMSLINNIIKNEKLDWIINCAGITDIEFAEKNKEATLAVNSYALNNLIQIAADKNATIIHISDVEVFDGTKFEGYTEQDEYSPITTYGLSKKLGDQIVVSYPKHIILRTSWLYGKYGINFVYTMLKLYGSGAHATIVDDQTGSPTYTSDIAKVIYYLISSKACTYGIYNCANIGQTDWVEYAKEILENSIKFNVLPSWIRNKTKIIPISTAEHITPVRRLQHSYLVCDKLEKAYGIRMRIWQSALDSFFQTIKKQVK